MPVMTYDTESRAEHTSILIRATVVDEDGVKIALGRISTLELTLYDAVSRLVLNGVFERNILNVPGDRGTYIDPGDLKILLRPADSPVLDDAVPVEIHRARIQFTYDSGAKEGMHEVEIPVLNRVVAVP